MPTCDDGGLSWTFSGTESLIYTVVQIQQHESDVTNCHLKYRNKNENVYCKKMRPIYLAEYITLEINFLCKFTRKGSA